MILEYEDKLSFGKHAGTTIIELIFKDPSYLLWMSKNIKQWQLPKQLRLNLEAYEDDLEDDLYPNLSYDLLHPDWGNRD